MRWRSGYFHGTLQLSGNRTEVVKFRLKVNHWWPRRLKKAATTLGWGGGTIYTAHDDFSAYLIGHEYDHIRRWRKRGFFKFLWQYLFNKKLRLEEEATAEASGWRDEAAWFQFYKRTIAPGPWA